MKRGANMKKKRLIGVIATGLVVVLAIGTTMAYLTHQTNEKLNNFTYSKSGENAHAILAMVTEPGWDGEYGYSYDKDKNVVNTYYDAAFTKTDKPTEDEQITWGKKQALDLLPGGSVNKDPRITNMGDIADVYVAMRVSFVYAGGSNAGKLMSDADVATVKNCLDISYNTGTDTTKWTAAAGNASSKNELIFYYNSSLAKKTATDNKGGATTTLFDTVTIPSTKTATDIEPLVNIDGGYTIRIDGFAIQSKNLITDNTTFPTWAATNSNQITFSLLTASN